MANYFEIVSKYKDSEIDLLPVRATENSAGYDLISAEHLIIPPYLKSMEVLQTEANDYGVQSLRSMERMTKSYKIRPTLISTGVKCRLDKGKYLKIVSRSSSPLKYWLVCANSEGIIDGDYYNNPDNEGEIFFQVINFSPFPIEINKGDKIAQGIICDYYLTENDAATGERKGGFGSTSK